MPTDSENTPDTKQREEAAARFREYLATAAELEVEVLATDESPPSVIRSVADQPEG